METGNKSKIKTFFSAILGIIAVMILILAFGGTGFGVFFWILKPPMDAKKILKNGVGTTATIISLHSNLTKDKVPYYFLKLSFHNSEGEEITVETSSLYSENFIRKQKIAEYNKTTGKYDIVIQDTVQIKYTGKKAILRSYVPEKSDVWLWTFPIVFGAIGLGFFSMFVYGIIIVIINSIIKKFGTPGIGKYLRHSSNPIAGVPRSIIYYTFENKSGKLVEAKSKYTNNDREAEALIEMQTFPIWYIGSKALIVLDEDTLLQIRAAKT